MPFLGQDWRSPGQSWVKTEEGWKKTTTDDKNNNVSVQRLVINRELRNGAVSEELWKLKCAITFVWLERDGGRRDFLQKSKQHYEQKQADTHTHQTKNNYRPPPRCRFLLTHLSVFVCFWLLCYFPRLITELLITSLNK